MQAFGVGPRPLEVRVVTDRDEASRPRLYAACTALANLADSNGEVAHIYKPAPGGFDEIMSVAARIKEGPEVVQPLQPADIDMSTPIIAFAATDIGRRRDHNEDAYLLDDDLRLYVVADGMGGANGGEVASEMAVQGVQEALQAAPAAAPFKGADPTTHPLYSGFAKAVRHANRKVFERGESELPLRGMGTTLTGIAFEAGYAFLAHVGDSRAYRIRGREIEQLSVDHTYVGEMIRAGAIDPDDADLVPWRHVLARAVGVEKSVQVDMQAVKTQPGDFFVLCSDGLANVVQLEEIRDAVLDTFLRGAPDRLVRMANDRGGPDNITVVVLCVNEEEANDDDGASRTQSAG